MLKIAPAGEIALTPSDSPVDSRPPRRQRLRGRLSGLFLATVAVPTLASCVYFGLLASDLYTSESRFVLRSPQRQVPTGIGAFLQSVGFTRAQDDTYTVHDYILSRDALRQLDAEFNFKKRFQDPSIDLPNRFGAIDGDDSFEALYEYYLRRVGLAPDSVSSISKLTVQAFDPSLARDINERLLQMSEALVNRLNERGRQDQVRFAAREVAEAEARATTATVAVAEFRNKKAVFDPATQSAMHLQLVSKLQDELVTTRTTLAQVRALSHDNPQIPALELRLRTLQGAIDGESRKVIGDKKSLSGSSGEYERLQLEREFADRQLAAAMSALEQARNDAQRKQLYLERIAQPSLSDHALEPRRVRAVLATFVLGLAAWGILTMLIAGIREHQD